MTTGPRNTPHPIILHVDESNNPVRLAEASSIYVTSATIVSATITTISATNWLGLDLGIAGVPGGNVGQIQYKKDSTSFGGDSALTFNEANQTLGAVQIIVGNFSSTNEAFFNNIARAEEFSSITLSAVSSKIETLSATTISAVTVCATNYNSLFDALSFTNLDARYLNSSGESVTGSFYLQNLSAAIFSATTYLNLPSGAAVWNASALAGKPVTSTVPGQYQVLVFNGNAWTPSSIAGIGDGATPGGPESSIQFRSGSTFLGSGTAKFNTTFSGLELVNTSSTNLSSTNIRSTIISATDYLNIPSGSPVWNAKKLQDYDILKGTLIDNDILSFNQTGGEGVGFFQKTTTTDYAAAIYPDLEPTIHANLPQTNASAIRNIAVTSTAPTAYDVLVYNGSVWTPSGSISLGTISATNLGGTNIVGTRANINNISATLVSATNLSAIGARVTDFSSVTISATTWHGLPSSVSLWNASLIKGASIAIVDSQVTGAALGSFVYNRTNSEYLTLPFSSSPIAGTRNYFTTPAQGQVVASYLGSATPSLQINPFFNTTGILPSINLPQNKDVLVFSSDLYGFGISGGWTWQQPSSLIATATPVTPFGSPGQIQFKGTNNVFSSTPDLFYNESNKYLGVSNIYVDTGGTIDTPWITIRSGFYSYGGGTINGNLSSISYTIFGKDTSSTGSPAPTQNNQTITYDSGAQKWKPGFAIYQATSIPDNNDGKNGDIYFRYIP